MADPRVGPIAIKVAVEGCTEDKDMRGIFKYFFPVIPTSYPPRITGQKRAKWGGCFLVFGNARK
jgi:hypothetical protein